MIRIETTAEFDAEGRFALQGQTHVPVAPGTHRVTVVVSDAETEEPVECSASALQKVGNVLVFTGTLLEDPEDVRRRLDEEATRRMLEGPFE